MEKKIYSDQEAFEASLEYFGGDELAAKVFVDKYALRDAELNLVELTPADMHRRIAKEFARIEKGKFKKPLSEEYIFNLLDRFKYIVPQGSPMYGIGNTYQTISLSNCYLLDVPEDSYGGVMKVDEQLVQISKRRGGTGVDLSEIRPAGMPTKNSSRTSTGILPFMERYSNSIREVGQAGRRGALMLTLSVHHPQVLDFTRIKNDRTKVTGANISLRLTDEFLNAVQNDEEYELRFPVVLKPGEKPVVSQMVRAREVWIEIIKNAHEMAEPGLLFWDNVTKNTPADYYEEYRSRGTNPCSEINLSPLDSCRLLLLNLFSYVVNPFAEKAYFDYERFYEDSKIAQRLMDDLVDLEAEKIEAIIKKVENDPEDADTKHRELRMWHDVLRFCVEGRRTGTGITALGDAVAACGVRYGSDDSIEMTEKIYKTLKLGAYRSSVDMAMELGSFKVYSAEAEKNCEYIQRIAEEDPELFADMQKYGRRNIALLTTAPAGSVSIETQTSSGIEPVFMMGYTRRKKVNPSDKNVRIDFIDKTGDAWQEFKVYHPKVKMWMDITGNDDESKSPWAGCCAEDIDWVNRVKLQAAAQKHVCHAISSTINLPNNVTVEKVAEIYEAAWKSGLKGITVYRSGCRDGVLVDTSKAVAVVSEDKITKTKAPKRKESMPAEVHHATAKGIRYYVAVGLLDGDPYEIFADMNHDSEGEIIIPKTVTEGVVVKRARGRYELVSGDQTYSLTSRHNDEKDALTRMISTALRHGADCNFVVAQLEKTRGDLQSFSKVLARTLKKYIADGSEVSGTTCAECKQDAIIRENGCQVCKNCGASKCM